MGQDFLDILHGVYPMYSGVNNVTGTFNKWLALYFTGYDTEWNNCLSIFAIYCAKSIRAEKLETIVPDFGK